MEVEILLEVFRMRNKYVAAAALSLLMMNPFNAGAAGKNGVAAVVNGEKITVAEMKQGYEDNRQIKEKVSFDDFYEKALEIYVNGKLLYQAAVAADVCGAAVFPSAVAANLLIQVPLTLGSGSLPSPLPLSFRFSVRGCAASTFISPVSPAAEGEAASGAAAVG